MSYTWQEIKCTGVKPLGRSSHSLDVIDKTAYVMGGEHEPRVPIGSDVWCLDVTSAKWRKLETSGVQVPPRNAHASAVVGSSIFIYGGRQGITMGEGALSDMFKLDTVTATWSPVAQSGEVPEARSYHRMAAVGTTLYVFGGCSPSGRLNDLHAFDTNTGVWQKLPSSADILGRGGAGFAAAAGKGKKLYVVGGFTGEEAGDVHEYDITSAQWRQILAEPPLPPRSVSGVVSLGSKLVVIGGEVDPCSEGHAGAGGFSAAVYVLDTNDPEVGWKKVVPKGGGGDGGGSDAGVFSPRGWFPVSAMGDDAVLLFGGLAPDNHRLDDTFLLHT